MTPTRLGTEDIRQPLLGGIQRQVFRVRILYFRVSIPGDFPQITGLLSRNSHTRTARVWGGFLGVDSPC